jgi:hypothetical protein
MKKDLSSRWNKRIEDTGLSAPWPRDVLESLPLALGQGIVFIFSLFHPAPLPLKYLTSLEVFLLPREKQARRSGNSFVTNPHPVDSEPAKD